MLQVRPQVAILGGGIRGAAIAALLAHSQKCDIVLLERKRIGSGATSTNHGRIHCGAGLWRKQVDTMAARHRVGGELIRRLSADLSNQQAALYLIESPTEAQTFASTCQHYNITCRQVDTTSTLIHTQQFAATFEIPEYMFRPANLAGRLVTYAREAGAEIVTGRAVQTIEAGGTRRFVLSLVDGQSIEADIVINALGSWTNELASHLPLPRIKLQWHRWKILCLSASDLPPAPAEQRVITVIESEDIVPSLIPHMFWMVFGCRIEPEILSSIEMVNSTIWSRFDPSHPMDRTLFDVHARYFIPLQKLSKHRLENDLYTFAGTYPASAGVYPYYQEEQDRPFQLLNSPEVPGYYAVSGENATTSLIDAIDTVHTVMQQLIPRTYSNEDIGRFVEQIRPRFSYSVYEDTAPMIWEEYQAS